METKLKFFEKYSKEEVVMELVFSKYLHGDNIAIIGYVDNELYDYLTCNIDDPFSESDLVSFRSDKPEYVTFLIENGYIKPEKEFTLPSGYIFIDYYKLTPEAFEFINKSLDVKVDF